MKSAATTEPQVGDTITRVTVSECVYRWELDEYGEASPSRILGSDATVAVGRFSPDGVTGYRARSGGPLRATRAEAEADERRNLDG